MRDREAHRNTVSLGEKLEGKSQAVHVGAFIVEKIRAGKPVCHMFQLGSITAPAASLAYKCHDEIGSCWVSKILTKAALEQQLLEHQPGPSLWVQGLGTCFK